MPSLQLRPQKDFSFHASPAFSALSFGTSCLLTCEFLLRIAISAPVILLYKFQNYLAEGCTKGIRENRLTVILPKSSRSSRSIRVALPLVFAPYHRLLREAVIQTQISLNVIATVYKLTICHNRILFLTASSQKVGGEYGTWEKAPVREAEDLGWQYPSTHPPYRQC